MPLKTKLNNFNGYNSSSIIGKKEREKRLVPVILIICWTRAGLRHTFEARAGFYWAFLVPNSIRYSQGCFMYARVRALDVTAHHLWSVWVPNGLKRRANKYIFMTIQQWPDEASDKSVNCPETRVKVLYRSVQQLFSADEMRCCEAVLREKREDAVKLNHSRCFQMTDLIQ